MGIMESFSDPKKFTITELYSVYIILQDSGVYTKLLNADGTEDDQAEIGAIRTKFASYLRSDFVPSVVFMATWNEMMTNSPLQVNTFIY